MMQIDLATDMKQIKLSDSSGIAIVELLLFLLLTKKLNLRNIRKNLSP